MAKSVELDTRVLDAIIKNLGGNVADAVAKAALSIEGRAKVKAPVDTGALRASIYTSTQNGDTSSAGTNPLPVPTDDHTAYVGPSVEYGLFVEIGTVRRAGTPYLQPAVRETEDEFRKLLADAVVNK